jgi:GT2 family glycosyltransferase
MRPNISASIVIYKSNLALLQKAVESFLNSTEHSTLYLINNSPSDEYRNHFAHPRIRYIFNNRNVGFGAGHNIALKEAMKDPNPAYHVILNPDIYFETDVIDKLQTYMDNNEQVGLLMPKILYPDGRLQPLCKLLPSPLTLFSRRFLQFFPNLLQRLNHAYEMHFSGYNKIMDVPFLSGCFMFLRLDALRQVGLFDERIFLYTEDADLSRRIHKHYRTVFFPEAVIYHYHQRESYKNIVILAYHISSAIKYFNKWGWFNDSEREVINQRILLKFSGD